MNYILGNKLEHSIIFVLNNKMSCAGNETYLSCGDGMIVDYCTAV